MSQPGEALRVLTETQELMEQNGEGYGDDRRAQSGARDTCKESV
jgi:hypothetical protein